MSDALKAGDLCVVVRNSTTSNIFNGVQPGDIVEIVRISASRPNGWTHKPVPGRPYRDEPWVRTVCLRKISDGDDRKVVRWDQCFWKPREVVDV